MELTEIRRELQTAIKGWDIEVALKDPTSRDFSNQEDIVIRAKRKADGKVYQSLPYPRPQFVGGGSIDWIVGSITEALSSAEESGVVPFRWSIKAK